MDGALGLANVTVAPLRLYSAPCWSSRPLRNRVRLDGGSGALTSVNTIFELSIVPDGISPSTKPADGFVLAAPHGPALPSICRQSERFPIAPSIEPAALIS